MSPQSQTEGTNRAVFGYSVAKQLVMLGCLPLAVMAAGASAALPVFDPRRGAVVIGLLSIAVFGGLAALAFSTVRKMWDKVAVDGEGVHYLPRKGDAISLSGDDKVFPGTILQQSQQTMSGSPLSLLIAVDKELSGSNTSSMIWHDSVTLSSRALHWRLA